MRTTYQNTSMRFGFFAHALFVPKTPNVMGFSGSVNGTTKHPGFFFILVFANVNGPSMRFGVFRACAFLANPPPPPPPPPPQIRAVYTCIKKPDSFDFFKLRGFFSVFFANVNACSNLAGYYLGFWSRGT